MQDTVFAYLDEDEFIDLKAYTLEELKEKIFSGEIEDFKTAITAKSSSKPHFRDFGFYF